MGSQGLSQAIRAFIEEENRAWRAEFESLGKKGGWYTQEQKEFAINKAEAIGVRATARRLGLSRRTIQRWLGVAGVHVKRCPDWVRDWAYWRRKRREKWERIRAHRGY